MVRALAGDSTTTSFLLLVDFLLAVFFRADDVLFLLRLPLLLCCTSGRCIPSWACVAPNRVRRVSHSGQIPWLAGVPFEVKIGLASIMVRLVLHFTQ